MNGLRIVVVVVIAVVCTAGCGASDRWTGGGVRRSGIQSCVVQRSLPPTPSFPRRHFRECQGHITIGNSKLA